MNPNTSNRSKGSGRKAGASPYFEAVIVLNKHKRVQVKARSLSAIGLMVLLAAALAWAATKAWEDYLGSKSKAQTEQMK